MQKRRNAFGYNVQASFITGYNGGIVAPPFERAYLGGENDIRGFDIRTVSPIAYLPSAQTVALRNPDGTFRSRQSAAFRCRINSSGACVSNCLNIPVPYKQLVTPGGDLSLNGNVEYRITIAGPVAIAPFVDMGIDPILRTSQLQINPVQYQTLLSTLFGCPILGPPRRRMRVPAATTISDIPQYLSPVPGTNWVVRMSTGTRIADDASGRQCAVPHLLCLQRHAPRQQRIAAHPDHPQHVPLSKPGFRYVSRPGRWQLHL